MSSRSFSTSKFPTIDPSYLATINNEKDVNRKFFDYLEGKVAHKTIYNWIRGMGIRTLSNRVIATDAVAAVLNVDKATVLWEPGVEYVEPEAPVCSPVKKIVTMFLDLNHEQQRVVCETLKYL